MHIVIKRQVLQMSGLRSHGFGLGQPGGKLTNGGASAHWATKSMTYGMSNCATDRCHSPGIHYQRHSQKLAANSIVIVCSALRRLPSRTTLYRHRLTFHTGFLNMLAMANRERGAERMVVYISSDSSPVASHDWLNTLICKFSESCLDQNWLDSQTLVRHGAILRHAADDVEDVDAEITELDMQAVQAAARLRTNLRMRPCTPVGVGTLVAHHLPGCMVPWRGGVNITT